MNSTLRMGRIAGVEIGAHWTWVFIVALIGWSLAEGVFPDANPGLSDATYTWMAVVAVPVFFACLVAHELGHAVQAQREGMRIEGITLWVFGGVARFSGEFPSAGAELRIALAGPAVSLALGVVALATAVLAPLPAAADGVVHWLGSINLLLLAFNMLPALPLDGGRVLRAILWRRRGDFLAATRAAATLGAGFGRLLIFGGVGLAILAGAVGGLWLALIGWFVLGAAEAEAAAAERKAALAGARVRDVMVHHPVTVSAELSAERFMHETFARHRHTAYPVVDRGRAVGIISFRAIPPIPAGVVRDYMLDLERTVVLRPDDALDNAFDALLASPLRRALVVADGRLVGLLSATDLLRLVEARMPLRGSPTPHAPAVSSAIETRNLDHRRVARQ
jgi:Zn-dependent protease